MLLNKTPIAKLVALLLAIAVPCVTLPGCGGARLSPKGQITFQSNRDGNGEIYVMNADGSNQRNITNNPDSDWWPSWSPDGTRIAFGSWRGGNCEIYVMNADGSNQRNITNNPAGDLNPSWSSQ